MRCQRPIFAVLVSIGAGARIDAQGAWTQSSKITPTSTAPSAQQKFGASIATFDDWALVGAFEEGGTGSAYLYERQGSTWVEAYTLYPNMMPLDDEFGSAVALTNGIAIVGAPETFDSGAVHVFEGAGTVWTKVAWFSLQPLVPGARLGAATAVDGEMALVGAPGSSRVFVLERSSGVWSWSGELLPNGGPPVEFGFAVALAGTTAVVGAPSSGSVHVFERLSGAWTETAVLFPDDPDLDRFGAALSILGAELLVGAPDEDGEGAAVLFRRDPWGWSQAKEFRSAAAVPNVEFGFSVVLGPDMAVVGAPGDEDLGILGSAHVYERSGISWMETAQLDPDVGPGEGTFGSSLACVGRDVLVNIGLNDSGVLGYVGAVNVWRQATLRSGKTARIGAELPARR
jgi:hypothetical protein